MAKNARIGDIVKISCPHGGTGIITQGSSNVKANSIGLARLGDKVVCQKCGKSGNIVSASPNVYANGIPVARVHDLTVGLCDPGKKCCPHGRTGEIIAGSPDVRTNGGS